MATQFHRNHTFMGFPATQLKAILKFWHKGKRHPSEFSWLRQLEISPGACAAILNECLTRGILEVSTLPDDDDQKKHLVLSAIGLSIMDFGGRTCFDKPSANFPEEEFNLDCVRADVVREFKLTDAEFVKMVRRINAITLSLHTARDELPPEALSPCTGLPIDGYAGFAVCSADDDGLRACFHVRRTIARESLVWRYRMEVNAVYIRNEDAHSHYIHRDILENIVYAVFDADLLRTADFRFRLGAHTKIELDLVYCQQPNLEKYISEALSSFITHEECLVPDRYAFGITVFLNGVQKYGYYALDEPEHSTGVNFADWGFQRFGIESRRGRWRRW